MYPVRNSDDERHGRMKVVKLETLYEKIRVNAKEAKSSPQRKRQTKQKKKSGKKDGVHLQALNRRS